MASFTDKTGTTWQVALTVGHLAPLKDLYGLDLGRAVRSQEAFAALFDLAPQDLVGCLWLVCQEQAERAGLSPEDFAYRFDGSTIEGATEALAEAVIGFFPRQKIAQALRGNLTRALARVDRETVRKLETSCSEPATNSPESSESIPAS